MDFINTTENSSSELRSERIPRSVFDFLDWVGRSFWSWNLNLRNVFKQTVGSCYFYLNFLFTVDGIARNQVLSDKNIFLALRDENSSVSVGLDDDLGTATSTSAAAAESTASAASASA